MSRSLSVDSEWVILLHGLARSSQSMLALEKALQAVGYNVQNIAYASRKNTIETLAEQALAPALKACRHAEKIHFVTHSMGGILVRQYLSLHKIPQLDKVVMLGPPNQGSEVVDKLANFPGFHWINGDAGLQLGTGESSAPNQLGRAEFDLGVIAGNRSINWLLSMMITGPDDGKVSVENTRLEGMNDHITLPVTHPFMMKNKTVIAQVLYYLQCGHFRR